MSLEDCTDCHGVHKHATGTDVKLLEENAKLRQALEVAILEFKGISVAKEISDDELVEIARKKIREYQRKNIKKGKVEL